MVSSTISFIVLIGLTATLAPLNKVKIPERLPPTLVKEVGDSGATVYSSADEKPPKPVEPELTEEDPIIDSPFRKTTVADNKDDYSKRTTTSTPKYNDESQKSDNDSALPELTEEDPIIDPPLAKTTVADNKDDYSKRTTTSTSKYNDESRKSDNDSVVANFFAVLLTMVIVLSWYTLCVRKRCRRNWDAATPLRETESVFLELIGSGGFAQVYELVGQYPPAIVKYIRISGKIDPVFIQREFETLKRIQHTNVVRLIQNECVQRTGEIGIVMEYCQRGNFKKLLLDSTIVYSMKTVHFWAIGLFDALQHIFEIHQCIHRDIKPENIFVTMGWLVKIGDFGTVKYSHQTCTGSFVGTQRYMSPLQYGESQDDKDHQNGNLQDSHRNDVYGLGLVLWEMVERRTVFTNYELNGSFDRDAFMQAVASRKLERLIAADCHFELQDIISRCTNFDRRVRPKAVEIFEEMKAINQNDEMVSRLFYTPMQQAAQMGLIRPIGFDGTEARVPIQDTGSSLNNERSGSLSINLLELGL